MLAHMTINGASTRTGDLFASGTVSGPGARQRGSFLELTRDGRDPVNVGGQQRTYLVDGDEVVITASAPGLGRVRIGFGEVWEPYPACYGSQLNWGYQRQDGLSCCQPAQQTTAVTVIWMFPANNAFRSVTWRTDSVSVPRRADFWSGLLQ
jgi:hypothetical protein